MGALGRGTQHPDGETLGAGCPGKAGKILHPRFPDWRASEGGPPEGSFETRVPRPRPPARNPQVRVGAPAPALSDTSQVILTQALHRDPPRILGGHGPAGLCPELRDAGRSVGQPALELGIPAAQPPRDADAPGRGASGRAGC
ncbi:uncharacterized protein LOC113188797 [Urocitellus parryii]